MEDLYVEETPRRLGAMDDPLKYDAFSPQSKRGCTQEELNQVYKSFDNVVDFDSNAPLNSSDEFSNDYTAWINQHVLRQLQGVIDPTLKQQVRSLLVTLSSEEISLQTVPIVRKILGGSEIGEMLSRTKNALITLERSLQEEFDDWQDEIRPICRNRALTRFRDMLKQSLGKDPSPSSINLTNQDILAEIVLDPEWKKKKDFYVSRIHYANHLSRVLDDTAFWISKAQYGHQIVSKLMTLTEVF